MNKLGAVIAFTYRNKVKTKSFRITTLLLALLIVIGMNIPYMIQLFSGNQDDSALKLGIATGTYNEIAQQISESAVQAQKQTQAAQTALSVANNNSALPEIEWQTTARSETELNR